MRVGAQNGTRAMKRQATTPAVFIAAAVGLLALPSAVLAFSSRLEVSVPDERLGTEMDRFGPGAVDPQLARALVGRSGQAGGLFRFTPAGTSNRPDRSVTVAVRVDAETARAITVRAGIRTAQAQPGLSSVHLAPTAYNLGLTRPARGSGQQAALGPDVRSIDMPDLSTYRPSGAQDGSPSRFAPRIALDGREKPGRAPRTFEGSDQTVDLGGAYRITRNLDVTAGVRYSTERDRLAPAVDGKQNSQAVYVGTQFRF